MHTHIYLILLISIQRHICSGTLTRVCFWELPDIVKNGCAHHPEEAVMLGAVRSLSIISLR